MEKNEEALCFVAPRARVLLVDDNEMNLKVEQTHLEPLGMQVDVACDGQEALVLMEQHHYDLVYMDQMMPVMDGSSATREFRSGEDAYHQNLPILCLTANVLPETRERCHEAGFSDFITKPVKAERMVLATRQWLDEELIEPSEHPAVTVEAVEREELPQIEGISPMEGVENSGSVEHWRNMLSDFHKVIDLKSEAVWDALNKDDLARYTVEVHALKSTARIIGAMELSGEFLELEELGRARDERTIQLRTPAVLAHLERYKDILAPYAMEQDVAQHRVSVEEMAATLQELYDAMDGFDLEGADAAMRRFEGYAISDELQQRRRHLAALVADVEMEAVMQEATELMELLKAQ